MCTPLKPLIEDQMQGLLDHSKQVKDMYLNEVRKTLQGCTAFNYFFRGRYR